tara:strand:- start:927 stop:1313 length:387 start_codon:yes stop_codon:yes gene_type:complete
LNRDDLIGAWQRTYATYSIKETNSGTLKLNTDGTYRDANGLGLAYSRGQWNLTENQNLRFTALTSNPLLTENRLFRYRIASLTPNTMLIQRAQAIELPEDQFSESRPEDDTGYDWKNSDTVQFERLEK